METKSCDVVVIGGGTGGYSAALRAAELGKTVKIVEKDGLGGTCLLRGCIPSKALLHAAELVNLSKAAANFGITFGLPMVDWTATQRAKDETVNKLTHGLIALMNRRKIEVVKGAGRLAGNNRVTVQTDGEEIAISAQDIVIATGSTPRSMPSIEIDGRTVITSNELLEIDHIPKSLAIIGGGYIGCEFASLFNAFGTKVTIIEAASEVMAREDREVKERLAPALRKRGIELRLGAHVLGADISNEKVSVRLEDEEPVEAEILLVAIGRRPVTENLDLENAGVKTDRGYVVVDDDYRAAPGIWAIGDCIPTLALAHASFAEGYYVAEKIAGMEPARPNYDGIPRVAYCFPEVTAVGMTEEEGDAKGIDYVIGRFAFQANSRALTMKDAEGFVKIIAEPDGGRILGMHMVGVNVSELASEAMLAVNWEASPADLGFLHHPHPTLSEAIGEAAMKLAGMPLHAP